MDKSDLLRKRMPADAKLVAWYLLDRGGGMQSPAEIAEALSLTLPAVHAAAASLRRHNLNVSKQHGLIVFPEDPELVESFQKDRGPGRKSNAEKMLAEVRRELAKSEERAELLQMRVDRLETMEMEAAHARRELTRLQMEHNELVRLMQEPPNRRRG